MENNTFQTEKFIVSVAGKSTRSKEDAVNSAFAELRKAVSGKAKGIVVYMKPVDIQVEYYNEDKINERYLGFLFSRIKISYEVKLNVTMEVSAIDL